jgi:DNA-binding transcriptional ArsR family regulator
MTTSSAAKRTRERREEQPPRIEMPSRTEMRIEAVLQALADPVRLDMVRQAAEAGHELACGRFEVTVTKSTLTHHLRTLREAGVFAARQQGTTRYHTLRRGDLDIRFPGLLDGVLAGVGLSGEPAQPSAG